MLFEITRGQFAEIQDALGLSNDELGDILWSRPNAGAIVQAIRDGRREVGAVMSLRMRLLFSQASGAQPHAAA